MKEKSMRNEKKEKRNRFSMAAATLAVLATAFAGAGVASTIILWKTHDFLSPLQNDRATTVFRVQSRSMEPAFCGPRFIWRCPECGEKFATALDVGSSGGVRSFFNATTDDGAAFELDGVEKKDEKTREISNENSPEARKFRETARFFPCSRCGFDRVPASTTVFQDGALVEFSSSFSDANDGSESNNVAQKRSFWRACWDACRGSGVASKTPTPRRWDVVIFRDPTGRATLKRVVGLPNESIEIQNGDVFIDGKIARRTLVEIASTAARLDSVEFRRTASRLSVASVAPIWNDRNVGENGEESRTTFRAVPISNESTTRRWNGADVAPVELVRDFSLRFVWLKPDRVATRFTLLVRRPDRAFRLDFDEKRANVSLRSIPLFDGKTAWGKTFETLTTADFSERNGEKTRSISDVERWRERDALNFRVFLVDGELILTVDAEEIVRFATDDLESDATAPIAEPFAILGDVARVGETILFRDVHYSRVVENANDDASISPNRYFLLGDNSPASRDSRFREFGTIAAADILFRVSPKGAAKNEY